MKKRSGARKRKIRKRIGSIAKSKQSVKNRFRAIRDRDDAEKEFGS